MATTKTVELSSGRKVEVRPLGPRALVALGQERFDAFKAYGKMSRKGEDVDPSFEHLEALFEIARLITVGLDEDAIDALSWKDVSDIANSGLLLFQEVASARPLPVTSS